MTIIEKRAQYVEKVREIHDKIENESMMYRNELEAKLYEQVEQHKAELQQKYAPEVHALQERINVLDEIIAEDDFVSPAEPEVVQVEQPMEKAEPQNPILAVLSQDIKEASDAVKSVADRPGMAHIDIPSRI